MSAYYNEIDPFAAQWLRNLISAGHISAGDVDERSIVDVQPSDLAGHTQCHFFAGIGGWSLALRLAGWPDDRPVWTGSCPCQDFSAAGKGAGFAGERHLWPVWFPLIRECRPRVVFGEQVASPLALSWLDLVQADMEGADYAFAAFDLCAAGVGAPHIRQRLGFVADATGEQFARRQSRSSTQPQSALGGHDSPGFVADADDARSQGRLLGGDRPGQCAPRPGGVAGGLGIPNRAGPSAGRQAATSDRHGRSALATGSGDATSPLHVDWRDADWLLCRDGKWRPVEPSPQPMVDGFPESLGRVRPEIIASLETEIVTYAAAAQIGADEILRDVCLALAAQAQRGWPPGRVPGLHEASFLLAFVCQLAAQGWRVAESLPLSRSQNARPDVRMLWDHEAAACASRQRGLEKQQSGERADALHILSSILARHAQTAWADAHASYAVIGFPLSRGEAARVGRLRAYGNAIVPALWAEFIGAYLDCCP